VWIKHGSYHESRERYALATVYYLVSKRRYEESYAILAELIAVLESSEVKMRALIARCNLVAINFVEGNKNMAVSQLKRVVQRYGLVCFSRSVFDESPGLNDVFQYAIDLKRIELPQIFIEIFIDLLQPVRKGVESIKPEKLLTSKELEIFELLAAGLTNAGISQQSDIALSTTKWHLKNIYTKLGVANRSGAMMIAHKN
jgi:LuxR family maltose regulon positive regulatory protein